MSKFRFTKNAIFTDFYNRLVRIEKSNNEFEKKNIGQWIGSDWQGFFQFLEKEKTLIRWKHVNNQSGGFWMAVLNWEYWNIYPAYLQIEEGKLCFKISTDPGTLKNHMPMKTKKEHLRNKLHNIIIDKSKELGIMHIKRPVRFGSGKYMTVAVIDKKNWLGADDTLIEIEKVVESLNSYKHFLKTILHSV